MDMTLDHDAICVQEVNQMYNLGCFAEQFVTYATACFMEQSVYYFVSDQAENAYKFCQDKLAEDIFCLPVQKQSRSALVPSGRREMISGQFKRQAAQGLLEAGAGKAAHVLMDLAKPANNAAEALLMQMQSTLAGCFEDGRLQLFAGLLQLAFQAKKLSAFRYWQFNQWLQDVTQDQAEERIRHDVHERIYTGFVYGTKDGGMAYYYNAVEAITLERQNQLRCQKQLVSPIFRKRYCFADVDMLNMVAQDFRMTLRRYLDKSYQDMVGQIYKLPCAVDKAQFLQVYDETIAEGNPLLEQTLNYYGSLWHIW